MLDSNVLGVIELASHELIFRQNMEKLEKESHAHVLKEEKLQEEIDRLKKQS